MRVRDGDVIEGNGFTFDCVFTPGHTSNHMCFALREEKALFTGDHVMGWSTTVVTPPDGDMRAYMASLKKLLARDDQILWPTHGGPVRDPKPFLQAYIDHRLEREAQIVSCLRDGVSTIPDMVARMYADVDPRLHPAAARSVLAHLIQLTEEGRVIAEARGDSVRAIPDRTLNQNAYPMLASFFVKARICAALAPKSVVPTRLLERMSRRAPMPEGFTRMTMSSVLPKKSAVLVASMRPPSGGLNGDDVPAHRIGRFASARRKSTGGL
jgi:hypothetical protein